MTRKKKWAIGCGASLLVCTWGVLSLLGLGGWSLTYYEVSEFRRSYAEGLGPVVNGVTVYCGMGPKTNAEYMWGFPFITFANDTDTHYVSVHFQSTKAEQQVFVTILDASLVARSARIHLPLVPARDERDNARDGWLPLRVQNHNFPADEYATFCVPDGVQVPRADEELSVVVRFSIRRGSEVSNGTLETPFFRFSETRAPYVSHPHSW